MKFHKIHISGNWGHFRKPEANNNPISYDIMPKTAFIGLVCAVNGYTREEAKQLYTPIANNLLYSLTITKPIKKLSTQFRIYKYKGSLSKAERPPQTYEILKDPSYTIYFRSEYEALGIFVKNIKEKKSIYTPCLGLLNCPANINYINSIDLEKVSNKELTVNTIIPKNSCNVYMGKSFKGLLANDSIPTKQNDNWQNTEYIDVFYSYSKKQSSCISVQPSDYEKQFQDKNENGYLFI